MGKKTPTPRSAEPTPFHNPFSKLGATKATLPLGPPPTRKQTASPAVPSPDRAVVRYERKGHGGKDMTRVEHLGLAGEKLDRWLKDIKQALGCGGVVEGETLLLQGDQRERLRLWLERRGVTRVTVS